MRIGQRCSSAASAAAASGTGLMLVVASDACCRRATSAGSDSGGAPAGSAAASIRAALAPASAATPLKWVVRRTRPVTTSAAERATVAMPSQWPRMRRRRCEMGSKSPVSRFSDPASEEGIPNADGTSAGRSVNVWTGSSASCVRGAAHTTSLALPASPAYTHTGCSSSSGTGSCSASSPKSPAGTATFCASLPRAPFTPGGTSRTAQ